MPLIATMMRTDETGRMHIGAFKRRLCIKNVTKQQHAICGTMCPHRPRVPSRMSHIRDRGPTGIICFLLETGRTPAGP